MNKQKVNHYKKYQNTDPRCHCFFTPEPLGYCWGYAGMVDEGFTQAEIIKKLCSKKLACEYWEEVRNEL